MKYRIVLTNMDTGQDVLRTYDGLEGMSLDPLGVFLSEMVKASNVEEEDMPF